MTPTEAQQKALKLVFTLDGVSGEFPQASTQRRSPKAALGKGLQVLAQTGTGLVLVGVYFRFLFDLYSTQSLSVEILEWLLPVAVITAMYIGMLGWLAHKTYALLSQWQSRVLVQHSLPPLPFALSPGGLTLGAETWTWNELDSWTATPSRATARSCLTLRLRDGTTRTFIAQTEPTKALAWLTDTIANGISKASHSNEAPEALRHLRAQAHATLTGPTD